MKTAFKILSVVLGILYPFILYFSDKRIAIWYLILLSAGLVIIRLVLFLPKERKIAPLKLTLIMGAILAFMGILAYFDQMLMAKFYPIGVTSIFLIYFSYTLFTPISAIERLVLLKQKEISLQQKRYIYRLTIVWCGFFVCQIITFILLSIYGSMEAWTLYTGVISYILMGTLIISEKIFRYFYKKKIATE